MGGSLVKCIADTAPHYRQPGRQDQQGKPRCRLQPPASRRGATHRFSAWGDSHVAAHASPHPEEARASAPSRRAWLPGGPLLCRL